MKTKKLLLIAALFFSALLWCGCTTAQLTKLPPVNAESFTYTRKDPAGGATVTATNVKTTTDANGKVTSITADDFAFSETYPFISVDLHIKGYRDGNPPQPSPAPAPVVTPPAVVPAPNASTPNN
jgi:hypothetical protein